MRVLYAILVALIVFSSCKKEKNNEDSCNPVVLEDPNFMLFPKTGAYWVNFRGYTYFEPYYLQYDTITIGAPKYFNVPTKHYINNTSEILPAESRLYYPVIVKKTWLDSNQVVTVVSIDTMSYIREDVDNKIIYKLEPVLPFDSAHYEVVLFNLNSEPGDYFNSTYCTAFGCFNIYTSHYDSIYFNSRYLKTYYMYGDPPYDGIYTSKLFSPVIQGFHIGTEYQVNGWNNDDIVWRKFVYNGQEMKISYEIE
jgi:hypothetical protein